MTLGTIGGLIGFVALGIAVAATACRLSPWWIFGAACVPTVVVLSLAPRATAYPCQPPDGPQWIFVGSALVSFCLWLATAIAALIDGVRLGRAGIYSEAASRLWACIPVSALAAGIVFFELVASLANCLD